ncbi:MAG TPA: TonB family protein [Polyangiaceae bacterium]|nr:TonB family protein [Polyangiaceae bacterium]
MIQKQLQARSLGVLACSVSLSTLLLLARVAQAADALVPPHVRSQSAPEWPANVPPDHDVDVIVIVTVAVDGSVLDAHVDDSVGADYDQAAINAVKRWQFEPATRNGKPIPARVRALVHFAPESAPSTAPPPAEPTPEAAPSPASTPEPASKPDPVVPDSASKEAAEDPHGPTEITVAGRARPPSRGTSDYSIPIGELASVPRKNASDLLKLAPGIFLSNEGGEGHAEQVFLRGFDAGDGQDIEFSLGGMPINESGNLHGNGYADTHFIIPELVSSLRVVAGPFDPRQGNYAVAGSASYELGLAQRGFTAKFASGSYGTQRLLLLWGPKGESKGTLAGAEIYKTDGFGQNRDSERATAMGQYEGRLGTEGSYRVLASAYATNYHAAGMIRQDDYQNGRIGFYDSYTASSFAHQAVPEGGDSARYSLAADLDSRAADTTLSQQLFLTYRNLRILENFTGFLLDVQKPLQSPHGQRGDMLDLAMKEATIGARGSARWHGQALDEPQHFELGYFARGDFTSGSQQRLDATTGHPYLTETNLDATLGDIGVYADGDLKPVHWLSLRGGARIDLFSYDVVDHCAVHDVDQPSASSPTVDQSCLSQESDGKPREPNQRTSTSSIAVMPRASLLFGPFAGFMLTASYGRGVRSVAPSDLLQDVTTPYSSIQSYEGGVGYNHQSDRLALSARSVFFVTRVDKDLIFDETAGRNVLGAGTTRSGWSGNVRATGRFFDESASLTLVRSTYNDTHQLVAYVPGTILRSDTAFFGELPWELLGQRPLGTLGLGATYVGPRALPFAERSDPVFTLDASATLKFTHYEIGVTVSNLFDTQYRLGEYNFASDFRSARSQPGGASAQPTLVPERMFTAGAPRAIYGSFAINFGGA